VDHPGHAGQLQELFRLGDARRDVAASTRTRPKKIDQLLQPGRGASGLGVGTSTASLLLRAVVDLLLTGIKTVGLMLFGSVSGI
jgi:hypothetical protein